MLSKKHISTRKKLEILIGILTVILLVLLVLALWLPANESSLADLPESTPSTAQTSLATAAPPTTADDPSTAPSGTTAPAASTAPEPTRAETSAPQETEPSAATEASAAPTETRPPEPTGQETESTQQTQPPETTPPITAPSGPPPTTQPLPTQTEDVVWSSFSAFSGQFVEDGTDRMVQNVAAILVTNRSDQFMDLATVTFDLDGKTASFIVTGLPAGRSAWVLESTGMTVTNESQLNYLDCVSSLRDGVYAVSEKVTVTAEGNVLTAVNNSGETLENVFIYYKQVRSDGSFFGGITYLVDFGTLAPGASARKEAPHYSDEISEIVRVGWVEAQKIS